MVAHAASLNFVGSSFERFVQLSPDCTTTSGIAFPNPTAAQLSCLAFSLPSNFSAPRVDYVFGSQLASKFIFTDTNVNCGANNLISRLSTVYGRNISAQNFVIGTVYNNTESVAEDPHFLETVYIDFMLYPVGVGAPPRQEARALVKEDVTTCSASWISTVTQAVEGYVLAYKNPICGPNAPRLIDQSETHRLSYSSASVGELGEVFFNNGNLKAAFADAYGEAYELRVDLNSEYREKRKETVKKVIANMTIGKDVSGLFADVVKNMQTEDIELKKLVYLYLINYAKTQPELVILAVNTFLKDTDDINPLIRALAIRTLGCLRVEKVVDYLMEPLKKSLHDEDPYVRKTSALCVAKIFDLNPAICIDNGLITSLQEMLSDRNPMVIANAVSALSEIHAHCPQDQIFVITPAILTKLLAALNECTEWGQIVILEALATYKPTPGSRESPEVVERVIARLQHANASVVLAAVKVLLIYIQYIDSDLVKQVMKKMAPPLVTLLASDPEIQYVALRNINLILQRHPQILASEIRVFFTKYNDPLYVKLEKLESIIKLASLETIDQVLLELKEYASEVDVEFVRRSVRAIGRCAVKLDDASERCVNVLLELIKTKVSYVVQEAVVVIKDIFRKYPNKYEGVIPALCENLEALEEPEAKASLVWIVGEYAERIENAEELLEYFVEGFKEESAKVQLQLLTSTVKLFLKKPGSAQELVQKILQLATQGVENPDIRDRAYIYWRLLSSNPQAAKAVVLAEKPPIESDNSTVSETLLDELIYHIGSLASVYHKPPALLGVRGDRVDYRIPSGDDDDIKVDVQKVVDSVGGNIENLLDLDFGAPVTMPATVTTPGTHRPSNVDDLLGMMDLSGGNDGGLMGGMAGSPLGSAPAIETPRVQLLSAESANGLDLTGCFAKRNGQLFLDMTFSNKSAGPLSDFAIQFNINSYGIAPASPLQVPQLAPGQTTPVSLPLNRSGNIAPAASNAVQIAIKCTSGVYYFQILMTDERVLA
ncbi:hypothetical protein HDU99_008137 [Rhizoclosmatium hyalinum]|nr:hypothetical protein HDU99_008137 [Rhizoclosmatium hyalinum]